MADFPYIVQNICLPYPSEQFLLLPVTELFKLKLYIKLVQNWRTIFIAEIAQLPRDMVQLFMEIAQLPEEMVKLSEERVQLQKTLCNAGSGATLSRKSAATRGNSATTRGNVAIHEE